MIDNKKLLKKIEDLRHGVSSRTTEKKNYPKIIYDLLPEKYRKKIEIEADYAGIYTPIHNYFANVMKACIAIELLLLLIITLFFGIGVKLILVYIILALGVSVFVPYILLTILSEHKKKNMEEVLPDLLVLVASNIRSGQTIDKALFFAARDEFGELSVDVRKTAMKIYSGTDIGHALLQLTNRVKSFSFKRTMKMLAEGLKSGGNIAVLLDESAADIRSTKILLKEIATSVQMMIMFIFIAGVLASPAMFAISNYLIVKMSSMWSGVDSSAFEGASAGGGLMSALEFGETSISPAFFDMFSIWCILITTIFGGMIVSQIKTGNIKDAVKYSPLFSVIAIGIYLAIKYVLFQLLGAA